VVHRQRQPVTSWKPILSARTRNGPAPHLFPETPWQLISLLVSITFFGRKTRHRQNDYRMQHLRSDASSRP
jgi:hypothetical protein